MAVEGASDCEITVTVEESHGAVPTVIQVPALMNDQIAERPFVPR
jgi:hypothetical protein